MQVDRESALAYITQGHRLLVFRHTQFPEAGIQVPGGTLEPGETPEQAVVREAAEETGLSDLRLVRYLGARLFEHLRAGRPDLVRRHYFHIIFEGTAPETWRHFELFASDGNPEPIEFEFYWVDFPAGVPELIGEQGALLDALESRFS